MTLPEQTPEQAPDLSFVDEGDFGFNLVLSGDWVADNNEMHEKFGVHEAVDKLDAEKLLKFIEFRINFLQEELDEAKSAYANLVDIHSKTDIDPVYRDKLVIENGDDIVDAMIDLCVVAIGTLNALGVDAYEAWDRVHAANMTKEVGIKASRPNPLGLPDLIKPAGWVSPTHSDNIGHFRTFMSDGGASRFGVGVDE
jgi:predicted HAD superfamily Cof-like phosphohydrolase